MDSIYIRVEDVRVRLVLPYGAQDPIAVTTGTDEPKAEHMKDCSRALEIGIDYC